MQSGMFATAYRCVPDEMKDYGLENLYRHRKDLEECSIFWDSKH